MKSRIVKELKEKYGVRRIAGKKLENMKFAELCFYLTLVENGEKLK